MDSIRTKRAAVFGFNDELRALVESVLDHHRPPQDLREGYVLFALGKAYKTHAAITLLCEQGYGEDAAVLSRTLFELAITTEYIFQDETGERARKFFEFDWVLRARRYNISHSNEDMRKEFEKRIAEDPTVKEKIDEILREAERVKAGYTTDELRKGWSGKSIKEIAEAAGRLPVYETAYALQCDLAHSAVRRLRTDKSCRWATSLGVPRRSLTP